jgi:lon-related putative ATP-dependent protease
MKKELNVKELYRSCEPSMLGCKTSEDAIKTDTIIGQERAVRALCFGLDIKNKGFNIYVSGMPGTGRTTAIERFLNEFASKKPVPNDWCYVNSFHDPLVPNAIRFPAGKAIEFKEDMGRTIEAALDDLKAAFDSKEYSSHLEELTNGIQRQKQDLLNQLNKLAQEKGFVLQPTPMGLLSIPIKDGEPLTEKGFMDLSEDERTEINQNQQELKKAIDETTNTVKSLDKQLREKVEGLDVEVARFAIQIHFEELSNKYTDLEEIPDHIEHVREDILKNVAAFIKDEEEPPAAPFTRRQARQDPMEKYAVNVIVDNANLDGAPVILEMNPTFSNLIGKVEHEAVLGALVTNFTLIRPGSLHRANGGFLVMPVEEVLRNPYAWDTLKRALVNSEINIEDVGERIGFSTKTLRPEPIPLDVKVILIGRPDLYQMLFKLDENFNELFKVKADFDTRMPRTDENIQQFMSFVCTLCCNENLKHLDQLALARLVEHASRLADDQEKMSAEFGEMSDVIREASYYTAQEEEKYVSVSHVERAIEERFYRSSLLRDRIQEMITSDKIKIDVSGEKVGQVNGLSVLGLGDITFGQPNRITASISLGKEGVSNIEREAEMSGPIHTKGVLILSGYLAEKFAQDKPLSLSARLVFEQSYSGVEGDSASSTELYALLSALSGLPIKQSIAVTGSVNQKGEVQVIGGVNEKIEGYFEICRSKGLSGEQGVMIPAGNVTNLMLKPNVVEAVQEGKFHIWAVDTIDEGIEILTGVKAGQRQEDGTFEAESVNTLVNKRLSELAERLEKFGKEEKKD